jgi:hypothetical protein
MTSVNRGVVRMLLVLLPGAGFGQATRDKPTRGVHISGRVIDAKGRPLSVVLSLMPLDRDDATAPITVSTRYDGLVSFSDVPQKKYKLAVPGGLFKILPPTLDVGAGDVAEIGDIVVQPDVTTDLKLEQIIVDPLVIKNNAPRPFIMGSTSSSLAPLAILSGISNQRPEPLSLTCGVHSDRFQTVEAFLGGKVKAIRVVRFLGSSEATPAEIQSRTMEVWLGVFRSAYCFMAWSEVTFWNLEASVEYEDGTRSSILMDGWIHVQVKDHEGRLWFIRLWPAVD